MNRLYEIGIGSWLWDLFRSGPMSLGFWGGLADAEVCARMTVNTHAVDWMTIHPSGFSASPACVNMINRSFESFSIVVQLGLYIACVCMVLASVRQWLMSKAMAKTFARELHAIMFLEQKQRKMEE